ncbi:MAG: BREX system Lon protease-like protein BrxL [Acetobacteraceae bacterium]
MITNSTPDPGARSYLGTPTRYLGSYNPPFNVDEVDAEWKDLLLRSVGLEPEKLSPRARDVYLLRVVPIVERNYNMVELGARE